VATRCAATVSEVTGSQDDECEDGCLVGCCITQYGGDRGCNICQVTQCNKRHGLVVNTLASYLGGPGFKPRPGDRLS
jgi:hypothetical protein